MPGEGTTDAILGFGFALRTAAAVLAALVATALASRGLRWLFRWVARRFPRFRLIVLAIQPATKLALYTVAVYVIGVPILGIRGNTLLVLSGAVGVAAGFAAQDAARNLLGGLVVAVQKPFQVGDRVKAGEVYGDVQDIGLFYTRVLTLDDTTYAIPNATFLTQPVGSVNTSEVSAMASVDLYVAREADLARARAIVEDAVLGSEYVNLARRRIVTLDDSAFGIRVRAKAYLLDFRFERSFATQITERAHAAFHAAGIAGPAVLPVAAAVR